MIHTLLKLQLKPRDTPSVPPLKRYTGPTLIVATPEENQPTALYKQMPNIPHKIMTGTSHWMQMDKPEEFNQILDEFLKTVDAQKQ